MPWTDGISNAFAQLAGGDATEARESARYHEELARRSLTDHRVERAAALAELATRKNLNHKTAGELLASDPRAAAIILGGLGQDFSGYQRGAGYEQQNDARGLALSEAQRPGADVDAINRLIGVAGNKLLAPGNVMVQPQAQATIGKTNAQAGQANAAAGASNALANLRGEQQRFVEPVATSVAGKNDAAARLSGARADQVAPLAAATIAARGAAADKSRATTPFNVNPQGTADMLLSLVGNIPGIVVPGAAGPAAPAAAPAPVDVMTALTGAPAAPAAPAPAPAQPAKPAVPKLTTPAQFEKAIALANAAIRDGGADPAAVRQRLLEMGVPLAPEPAPQ